MSIENPLGLQDLLVNTIIGSTELFMIVAIIFFSTLAGRFQMANSVFLIMISLFVVIFSALVGGKGLFLLVLLIAGFAIFAGVKNITR